MAEIKTKPTDVSVDAFLDGVEHPVRAPGVLRLRSPHNIRSRLVLPIAAAKVAFARGAVWVIGAPLLAILAALARQLLANSN